MTLPPVGYDDRVARWSTSVARWLGMLDAIEVVLRDDSVTWRSHKRQIPRLPMVSGGFVDGLHFGTVMLTSQEHADLILTCGPKPERFF